MSSPLYGYDTPVAVGGGDKHLQWQQYGQAKVEQ